MARITKREAIEVLSFTEYQGNNESSLLGFATVRIDRVVVSGIRLMLSKAGNAFVNMPSQKGSDGNYYNTVWTDTGSKTGNKELYEEIAEAVKAFYEAN